MSTRVWSRWLTLAAAASWAALVLGGCNSLSEEELEFISQPHVRPIFNHTGTREQNARDINATDALVQRIDAARGTLDMAIYGFSNRAVIDAVVRAWYRGVDIRVVGDARHFGYGERGYRMLQEHHIPMQVGNQFHIMHNKFFIIDDMFVFVGTGNITSTGFDRNNNNWVLIESPPVAADFRAEFEQMWNGRFSSSKKRLENGNTYQVGDTTVEVYFSPQEDAMGRILEEVGKATHNIHFTIFAFTKDQVGSAFIEKHRQFLEEGDEPLDIAPLSLDGEVLPSRRVTGIMDRSQVHGNFLYHEVYRMMAMGVPMKMDANENSRLPGDYQAGGGRLHSKTMILDVGTPNARVLTGSFNWSSAATISNDEALLVLRGERIAEEYYREFVDLWGNSKEISQAVCNYMLDYDPEENALPVCADAVEPGDVIISEVHWNGWNGLSDPSDHTDDRDGNRDPITNDEFIELYNTTDRPINLSLWTITNGYDFKVGFTPGTVIHPGQYFLILDHNIVPYTDVAPQRGEHAFRNGDFVLNMANDPRFPRLNLKDSSMELQLVDAEGETIDRAGNSGPPFAGGTEVEVDGEGNATVVENRSMERIIENGQAQPGDEPGSWKAASGDSGGSNVNPDFRDVIIATPGEPNSQ